ncbi:hypothetical protein F511_12283 [Dorcoceras hygrometricum]|uniref:Uncharacterized protein n=1 Tax=Dorcoceras hygrometricum TaxID=472368 RepID=A0A2Z7BX16_9LAMI|nr:hypothetical protein F511_12283 [Dorcoceras hygrometricum]
MGRSTVNSDLGQSTVNSDMRQSTQLVNSQIVNSAGQLSTQLWIDQLSFGLVNSALDGQLRFGKVNSALAHKFQQDVIRVQIRFCLESQQSKTPVSSHVEALHKLYLSAVRSSPDFVHQIWPELNTVLNLEPHELQKTIEIKQKKLAGTAAAPPRMAAPHRARCMCDCRTWLATVQRNCCATVRCWPDDDHAWLRELETHGGCWIGAICCAVARPCFAHHAAKRAALCRVRYVAAAAVRQSSDSDAMANFLLGLVRAYPGLPVKFSGRYSISGRFCITAYIMSSFKNPLAAILDSNKFTGLNYQDWLRNLNLVLASEKLLYTIEKCPPKEAPADISHEELVMLKQWWDDEVKARCYCWVAAADPDHASRRGNGRTKISGRRSIQFDNKHGNYDIHRVFCRIPCWQLVHGSDQFRKETGTSRDTASRGPTTIVAPESQFQTCPTDHGKHIYLKHSSTLARDLYTIIPSDSIGYPRMSASGESSTTMHRLLHASGSHPIPPPDDPKRVGKRVKVRRLSCRVSMTFRVVRTNQYNQDLELIHSKNG